MIPKLDDLPPNMLIVHHYSIESNNVIQAKAGDTIGLRVRSNPSTGYTWIPARHTDFGIVSAPPASNWIRFDGCLYQPNPPPPSPPGSSGVFVGGGGHDIWVYTIDSKAKSGDVAKLELMHIRPWLLVGDSDDLPEDAKLATVNLVVL